VRNLTDDTCSRIKRGAEIPLSEAEIIVNEFYENYRIVDDRFHSFFFNEACLLISIARYIGDGDTHVTFCEPNSAYDGKIRQSEDIYYVEFTAAIDGHNESLIMELVNDRGSAPMCQQLHPKGRRGSRVWEDIEEKVVSSDFLDKQMCELLLD
jgi:hypothetical protein